MPRWVAEQEPCVGRGGKDACCIADQKLIGLTSQEQPELTAECWFSLSGLKWQILGGESLYQILSNKHMFLVVYMEPRGVVELITHESKNRNLESLCLALSEVNKLTLVLWMLYNGHWVVAVVTSQDLSTVFSESQDSMKLYIYIYNLTHSLAYYLHLKSETWRAKVIPNVNDKSPTDTAVEGQKEEQESSSLNGR